jgi:hypothetical protein
MKSSTVVTMIAIVAAALYVVAKRNAAAGGTPMFSLGSVGGTAHSADITTGGVVSVLGAAIPSLTKLFGGTASSPAAVQTDQWAPWLGSATISNPVQPSPAVLPYSYKQQNLDTSSVLGTSDLFTPSSVTGSSGTYADDSTSNFNNVDYSLGS